MKQHEVLVLGAGFSKPAGGPLLRELLVPEFGPRLQTYQVASSIDKIREMAAERAVAHGVQNLEAVFTEIWQEARTGGSVFIGRRSFEAEPLWDHLTIHLAGVCDRIRLRRSTKLWGLYGLFLSDLYFRSKSLTIVTFNYDLLVEQMLDAASIRFDYGKVDDLVIRDAQRSRQLSRYGSEVSVLKMHGSANWGFCEGCRKAADTSGLLVAYEDAYVPARRRRCPYCDERLLSSGIVPPIVGKAGEGKKMQEIWGHARKTLERADRVTIIGYSLPSGDNEARSLLRGQRGLLSESHGDKFHVVCGPGGVGKPYADLLPKSTDTGLYVEQYMEQATADLV